MNTGSSRRGGRPQRLGEILAQETARLGLGRVKAVRRLELVWARLVGSPLDEFTQPGSVRRGTLEVLVAASVIMHELSFRKPELIARLQEEVPEMGIQDIRFRIGSFPFK
ncbi:MAG: DUF721 domain-containing protein [Planctomycetota bacterium]|nr:MAG: DUF721 domain-containing protein [Planctomycetota bacterium]